MNDSLKAYKIESLEKAQSTYLEDLEGADLFTVLVIFANSEDITSKEALETGFFKTLISATQSNPEQSYEDLKKVLELDDEIEKIDQGR